VRGHEGGGVHRKGRIHVKVKIRGGVDYKEDLCPKRDRGYGTRKTKRLRNWPLRGRPVIRESDLGVGQGGKKEGVFRQGCIQTTTKNNNSRQNFVHLLMGMKIGKRRFEKGGNWGKIIQKKKKVGLK